MSDWTCGRRKESRVWNERFVFLPGNNCESRLKNKNFGKLESVRRETMYTYKGKEMVEMAVWLYQQDLRV